MTKMELYALQNEWYRLYMKMERDGGRDNAIKEKYYSIQNRLLGLRVFGIHTGDEYEIVGITECDNLPAFQVRRLKDGKLTCVCADNLRIACGGRESARRLTQHYLEELEEYDLAVIPGHDSNTGDAIWFDGELNIIEDHDEVKRRLLARPAPR